MIPHSRPTLGPEEKQAIEEVLASGQMVQGKKVAEFEASLARFVGRRYGMAVGSGTSALHLSLLALGISAGDEVILPSFTCAALLHALDAVGARPVLADIDPEDFNLSAETLKKKIRKKTRAVIVPHSFGRPADMKKILDFGIPVIEDGTQALGSEAGGRPVGSFGAVSVFSFYATKMITTGEGGMVLTDSRKWADFVRDLRDYDKKTSYRFRVNSKMTDLAAAMGVEQLKKLPDFIGRRREIAARYREFFQNQTAVLPKEDRERPHVYYRFVVRVPKAAKAWLKEISRQGIDAKEPVFKPLHRYLGFQDSQFPATARAVKECVSLPIFPSLTDGELDEIGRVLRGVYAPV